MVFIIQVVGAQEYGDMTITTNVVWKDQVRIHSGMIYVDRPGHLILDNTTIIFNGTGNKYISVRGNNGYAKLTTKNNTLITVLDKNTMWTSIAINNGAHADLSDSKFERFKGSNEGAPGGGSNTAGISFFENGYQNIQNSTIDNITMTNYSCISWHCAIKTMNIREPINILNSTFISNISLIGQGNNNVTIYYINPTTNINGDPAGRIEGNTFINVDRGLQFIGTKNIRVFNNTFINAITGVSFFDVVSDSYNGYNKFITTNPLLQIYTLYGCNTNCNNNTFEGNIRIGYKILGEGGPTFNLGDTNITYRDNIVTNASVWMASGSAGAGRNNKYFRIYNNTMNGTSIHEGEAGYRLYASDSLIYDNIISNMTKAWSACIFSKTIDLFTGNVDPNSNYYSPKNITFINNTCTNINTGIVLKDGLDINFIDQKMNNILNSEVRFYGNNTNIKFINSNINSSKVYFNNIYDSFDNYNYADIVVQDSNGNPINGASIGITNIDNSNYPSINRNGVNKTTFTTVSDGHTKLPTGNDSDTVVLMSYFQNKT